MLILRARASLGRLLLKLVAFKLPRKMMLLLLPVVPVSIGRRGGVDVYLAA